MIQNSPLLVAQATPTKNATSSPSSKQTVEQGESFKQMLSKQVRQEEAQTKKPVNQPTNEKVGNEDKQALLKSKQVSDQAKVEDQQDSLLIAASDIADTDTDTEIVDAQLLASTATAKTLEDVTDGEVVLNAAPSNDVVQQPIANFTPLVQPVLTQQSVAVKPETAVEDVPVTTKGDEKQPLNALTSGATVKDDTPTTKVSQQPVDAAADNDKVSNKFANYISADRHSQRVTEQSTAPASASPAETSTIATASIQSIAKAATPQMLPPEQVGLSNTINAYPGKTGWNEAIGQKVVWMVGAAEQSATLTLNPKDLGPLQVIINVNNEKADATFISDNPEVRKALEDGMSNLRQSMGQAGVELGQANVNSGKQHQDFQQASKEYFARQADNRGAQTGADVGNNTLPRTRVSNGLVDTFV